MYKKYWGLNESPFQNTIDPRWFHESPAHEEAMARLYYLIEQRRRFGLFLGSKGAGKSLLMEVLVQQVRRTQRQIAMTDLFGRNEYEMLWELSAALELAPAEDASQWTIWRNLSDHLQSLQSARIQTVVVFDHMDRADEGCIKLLQRLLHISQGPACWTTFIVCVRSEALSRLPSVLTEMSDLRVELGRLDHDETQTYLADLMSKAGCQRNVFADSAIDSIYEQTAGQPRAINRLCDLSLLAAMGEGRDEIDADIVQSAAAEVQTPAPANGDLLAVH